MTHDIKFMKEALKEAQKAAKKNEAPIGAVAVREGKIVARAHNLRELRQDPLGHAEIYLLQKLSKKYRTWRLEDVIIYVTLEPCLMCMGALLQARVKKVVFGTKDPKAGACGSVVDVSQNKKFNHQIEVISGVLQEESGYILTQFFKNLRSLKKN